MVADGAVDDDAVAGPGLARRQRDAHRYHADAGGVDEDLVGGAATDHLGVAGDDPHAGLGRDPVHAGHDAAQRLDRKSFFEDDRARQVQGPRASHGQVVDGAAHGQRTDVAAGEEQRVHDVAVGAEREPVAVRRQFAQRHAGLVFHGRQQRIVERRGEHLGDQRVHGLAATTVAHVDVGVAQRHAGTCVLAAAGAAWRA